MISVNHCEYGTAFIPAKSLPITKSPFTRTFVCAQYLPSDNFQVNFRSPSKSGSFGRIFFGEYGDFAQPNRFTDVVVKCPVDSQIGRKLYEMERYTNMKLRKTAQGASRFPQYLGEVIIPGENDLAPGLIRLGLVWQRVGNGDTLEDLLTSSRITELGSLLQAPSTASPLRRNLAAKLVVELAYILRDLQQRGIIHRDMKPENILAVKENPNGMPLQVIDFGSSCDWSSPFKKGLGLATCDPIYVAPERRLDIFKPGYRFDVYSLGLIALRAALPSLTDGWAMNDFVRKVLGTCGFSFSRACSAVLYDRVQCPQAVKNDIKALTDPMYEDMYAFFATVLTEEPKDRAAVSDCIRSRFAQRAAALSA